MMTNEIYFPKRVFNKILEYCDDSIERRQKKYHRKVVSNINYLTKYISTIYFQKNDWNLIYEEFELKYIQLYEDFFNLNFIHFNRRRFNLLYLFT